MGKWILGLNGLVLGLGSVFLILLLLILFITIMSKVVQNAEKGDKGKEKTVPAKAIQAPAEDEDEVIAVIAAAVACMAQREGKRFKIRSFKRV